MVVYNIREDIFLSLRPLQAISLRTATGCLESDRKLWERSGVLIPAVSGCGAGVHAAYDEANVLAVAIAMQLKSLHVVVTKYQQAFRQLHHWLRNTSSVQWRQYRVVLTPDEAVFRRHREPLPSSATGYVIGLDSLVSTLFCETKGMTKDLPFGLSVVSK